MPIQVPLRPLRRTPALSSPSPLPNPRPDLRANVPPPYPNETFCLYTEVNAALQLEESVTDRLRQSLLGGDDSDDDEAVFTGFQLSKPGASGTAPRCPACVAPRAPASAYSNGLRADTGGQTTRTSRRHGPPRSSSGPSPRPLGQRRHRALPRTSSPPRPRGSARPSRLRTLARLRPVPDLPPTARRMQRHPPGPPSPNPSLRRWSSASPRSARRSARAKPTRYAPFTLPSGALHPRESLPSPSRVAPFTLPSGALHPPEWRPSHVAVCEGRWRTQYQEWSNMASTLVDDMISAYLADADAQAAGRAPTEKLRLLPRIELLLRRCVVKRTGNRQCRVLTSAPPRHLARVARLGAGPTCTRRSWRRELCASWRAGWTSRP